MPFPQEILGTYRWVAPIEKSWWIGEIELIITNIRASIRLATGSSLYTASIPFNETEALNRDNLETIVWEWVWVYTQIEKQLFWNSSIQDKQSLYWDKFIWYLIPGGSVLLVNKTPVDDEFWLLILDIEGTSILYTWRQVLNWKFNRLVDSLLKNGKILERLN